MNITINARLAFFGFVIALLFSSGIWALPRHDADSSAQQTNRFQHLYKDSCAACHGEHGDGKSRAEFGLNPPPRDFTTEIAREELSRERMITSVTYGRPGTAMVGWGSRLEGGDIAGIVDFIRATFMKPAKQDKTKPDVAKQVSKKAVHPGQIIYKENCAVCHGDNGNGAVWTQSGLNPPPRNFTAAESRAHLTAERMTTSVTFGRPGTAMMPFNSRLTKEQIANVVDYIRTTFMESSNNAGGDQAAADDEYATLPGVANIPHGDSLPANEAVHTQKSAVIPADMSLPLPHGLVGDPDKGRQFYSKNCFTCHGLKGNGQGPRASFIHPSPRNFIAAQSRRTLNRPALFKAITAGKPGTVMPAWGKVLSDQEIANVAEYVFETFIQEAGKPGADQQSHTIETGSLKKKVISN